MTECSSFQPIGEGQFRVSGAVVSPTTGRYIITCAKCAGDGWVKRNALLGPTQCTACHGKGKR